MSSHFHSLCMGILFNSNSLGIHLCKALQPKPTCKRRQKLPTLSLCWQWCANGCNNSQHGWDLHCIVGRIQPIKLWRPCVMSVCGPISFGRAVQTDPTLLRYASVITEQKKCWEWVVDSKVWSVSNFVKQLPTTRNNIQQGGKKTPHVTYNNVGSCWPTMSCLNTRLSTWLNNFKTKLGGEICALDLNKYKGLLRNTYVRPVSARTSYVPKVINSNEIKQ